MMSLLLVYLYFYCEHTCLLCLGNENKSSFHFLLFCISLDLHISGYDRLRLGNENKSSFHFLLFCISLDLHYLCMRKLWRTAEGMAVTMPVIRLCAIRIHIFIYRKTTLNGHQQIRVCNKQPYMDNVPQGLETRVCFHRKKQRGKIEPYKYVVQPQEPGQGISYARKDAAH